MVNTKWTTCGRKLLLNGKSFFVRGVNYAPTPIGQPGRLDVLGNEGIFTRDLKNLRGMHANAVKVSHASTKSGDGETALLTWWDLATT
jgi:beta-galactosidase/beta-glucuronidase